MLHYCIGFGHIYNHKEVMMPQYPIKPSDIETSKVVATYPDREVFGSILAGQAAQHLVRIAQRNGGWSDFSMSDIGKDFPIAELIAERPHEQPPWIKDNHDGTFSFTHRFIAQIFAILPAITQITD